MANPFLMVVLDAVSFVAAAGLGYYAFRLFLKMRFGKLERSWMLITQGAMVFSLGFLVLIVQDLSSAYRELYLLADYIGTALATVGMILFLFGMRSHYSVWTLKNEPSSKGAQDLHLIGAKDDTDESKKKGLGIPR